MPYFIRGNDDKMHRKIIDGKIYKYEGEECLGRMTPKEVIDSLNEDERKAWLVLIEKELEKFKEKPTQEGIVRISAKMSDMKGLLENKVEKAEVDSVQNVLDKLRRHEITVPESNRLLERIRKSNIEAIKSSFAKPEPLTSEKILEDGKRGKLHDLAEFKRQETENRNARIKQVLGGPKEIKQGQIQRDSSFQARGSEEINREKRKKTGMMPIQRSQ